MTYTGLSCVHKREKSRHGCSTAKEYYCADSGKIIDPHSCYVDCESMQVTAHFWRQLKRDKMKAELL